jgi:hypothetical protein
MVEMVTFVDTDTVPYLLILRESAIYVFGSMCPADNTPVNSQLLQ